MKRYEDLTGKTFGKLTAIKYAYSKNNARYWLCKCSCGNEEVYVTTGHLKSGHTKSCGCKTKKDIENSHYNFKGNQYEEYEYYFVGVDSKNNKFVISKEDYEECSKHCWTAINGRQSKNGKYFSARMSRKSAEGHKMKMLHNFIWELHNGKIPEGYRVDHINQKPWDYRYENLRLADKSLNAINVLIRENNSSGVTGVCFASREQNWRAFINYQGKRIELGRRKDKNEAIKLRLEAELKYYGEIAPQRHLFKQYGIEVDEW